MDSNHRPTTEFKVRRSTCWANEPDTKFKSKFHTKKNFDNLFLSRKYTKFLNPFKKKKIKKKFGLMEGLNLRPTR